MAVFIAIAQASFCRVTGPNLVWGLLAVVVGLIALVLITMFRTVRTIRHQHQQAVEHLVRVREHMRRNDEQTQRVVTLLEQIVKQGEEGRGRSSSD